MQNYGKILFYQNILKKKSIKFKKNLRYDAIWKEKIAELAKND
jgi:hypothetical protein